jgi:hypothetical protein|tara:strand:+ start:1370 stop:1579 length:210 start_codon:yes stop_codon:yes gene_type:complete
MKSDDLLVAVAALGGDDLDPERAALALEARADALESIRALRRIPLALVGAIEPGHAQHRLALYRPKSAQ